MADPSRAERALDTPGSWSLLDPGAGAVRSSGRPIGGRLETASILAGTPVGDVRAFADRHAPEGLVVHVEASGDGATDVARHLWRLRPAGWFERANGVLVGRTGALDSPGLTRQDALRSALGRPGRARGARRRLRAPAPAPGPGRGALAEVEVGEAGTIVQQSR